MLISTKIRRCYEDFRDQQRSLKKFCNLSNKAVDYGVEGVRYGSTQQDTFEMLETRKLDMSDNKTPETRRKISSAEQEQLLALFRFSSFQVPVYKGSCCHNVVPLVKLLGYRD